jgi:ketosteroid isomerase-like protein
MGKNMTETAQTEIVRNGWAALAAGEFDKLASDYAEDMIFVLPGQDDVLEGRAAFRSALDTVGQALPGGFEIKSMTYCTGENEVVTIIRFTADKLPNGSQCAVLFRFNSDDKIIEERWFVDTEQWKAAV